jgi:chemotaxis protein methyltransferase CheR
MTPTLTASRLGEVSEFIAGKFGLNYPPERTKDLERLLGQAAQVSGYPDRNAFIGSLLTDSLDDRQLELLASILTVGETYFYRDPKVFDLIVEHFVPQMVSSRPGLPPRCRIWSAGCCTGEEAYTLAIVFDRMQSRFPSCELDLLATDINPHFLRKARAGIYRSWSFRGSPPWLQASYFSPMQGDRFEVRVDIRRKVRFAALNLAEFKCPSTQNRTGTMDLILCRNVLMYFTPGQFSRAVHNLAQCLVEGGWLILSAAEVSHVEEPELVPTRLGNTTIFVKRSKRHRPPESPTSLLMDRMADPALLQQREQRLNHRAQQIFGNAMPDRQSDRHEPAALAFVGSAFAPSAGPAGMIVVARSEANQGQWTSALETCTRLLQGDKMNPVAHYLRATICQELGMVHEAERTHKRVLYLDPDFIAAHVSLASLARGGGRTAEARRHLRNALSLADKLSPDCAIPESEGMTAGRLVHILTSVLEVQSPPIRAGRVSSREHQPQRMADTARHT